MISRAAPLLRHSHTRTRERGAKMKTASKRRCDACAKRKRKSALMQKSPIQRYYAATDAFYYAARQRSHTTPGAHICLYTMSPACLSPICRATQMSAQPVEKKKKKNERKHIAAPSVIMTMSTLMFIIRAATARYESQRRRRLTHIQPVPRLF